MEGQDKASWGSGWKRNLVQERNGWYLILGLSEGNGRTRQSLMGVRLKEEFGARTQRLVPYPRAFRREWKDKTKPLVGQSTTSPNMLEMKLFRQRLWKRNLVQERNGWYLILGLLEANGRTRQSLLCVRAQLHQTRLKWSFSDKDFERGIWCKNATAGTLS